MEMALTETPVNNPEKKSTDHKPHEKKEKALTKLIIRRLPPNIDQETFLNQVSPIPDYNHIYIVKGDLSLGENAFGRVYINFVSPEEVYNFKERFDNYVFLDQRGHEYPAVVEFASFQKIPKKRNKNRCDPKCGTIESDPLYLEFIEIINKPQEQDEKPEFSLQLNTEAKVDAVDTTPLLEYIKNRKAQRLRTREVRREERKRKELDRKKAQEERRKHEEKSPTKIVKSQSSKSQSTKHEKKDDNEEKAVEKLPSAEEKPEKVYEKPYGKYKERKFEEKKRDVKPKYPPRKEYPDKRDYKERDHNRSKQYDDSKKEETTKPFPKKVKKYSEKREERKMEAQKAEQKKLELAKDKERKNDGQKEGNEGDKANDNNKEVKKAVEKESVKEEKNVEVCENTSKSSEKCKDGESAAQRRIRNKDRPTIAIYRPGMLSKRKQVDSESENKDGNEKSSDKS